MDECLASHLVDEVTKPFGVFLPVLPEFGEEGIDDASALGRALLIQIGIDQCVSACVGTRV
jgi:hypothetical protein